jgi:hypothetical protein
MTPCKVSPRAKQGLLLYIKGTASFVSQNTISVQLDEGSESTMKAKKVITAARSENSSPRLYTFRLSATTVKKRFILHTYGTAITDRHTHSGTRATGSWISVLGCETGQSVK